MNQSWAKVLDYLTGADDIETVSAEELQKLAEDSPYFSVTQFLLAKKLKALNDPSFLEQAQKTALYFPNPYWLDYQLNNDFRVVDRSKGLETLPLATVDRGRTGIEEEYESRSFPVTNPELLETEGGINKIEIEKASDLAESRLISTDKTRDVESVEESSRHALKGEDKIDNAEPVETAQLNEHIGQPEEEMAAITRDTDESTDEFVEQLTPAIEASDKHVEETRQQPETNEQGEEVTEVSEEMAGVTRDVGEATEKFLEEAEKLGPPTPQGAAIAGEPEATSKKETYAAREKETIEARPADGSDEHEKMFQNIKAMLDATSEEADADIETSVVPIDPYYTIDYFASQGIKLELEPNPQDQLGQNLKKFTSWLKHMKKLGPEDATEVIIRKETDAEIVQIADSSNTVREVVTEAMALVLEKQGKKDKAIELYNKLSFLNPHKRTYFADKIKNLKGS